MPDACKLERGKWRGSGIGCVGSAALAAAACLCLRVNARLRRSATIESLGQSISVSRPCSGSTMADPNVGRVWFLDWASATAAACPTSIASPVSSCLQPASNGAPGLAIAATAAAAAACCHSSLAAMLPCWLPPPAAGERGVHSELPVQRGGLQCPDCTNFPGARLRR